MGIADQRDEVDRLFRKYAERVSGYVLARVRNPEIAETVTSRVFLRVVEHMAQCRQDPGPWLWSIARNELARFFRERKPQDDLPDNLPAAGLSPVECAIEREAQSELLLAVAELPVEQRDLLQMKFFLELKNTEIATALNVTPNHVGVLLHRALRKLRDVLASRSLSSQ